MLRRFLCLSVALAAMFVVTGQAFGATLVVDDDKVQCPTATFTSIQLAVTAAAPGDTVRVCPGTYNETVSVPKTLTITGTLAGSARSRCFGSPPPPNPTQDAILQGIAPVYGIGLLADNIVFENFVVQNTANAPGVYQSGLFSGYLVRNNIIQNNTFGLYANASGATQSVIRANCFRANNRPGSASGNAMYADQGSRNILIEFNRSTLHVSAFNVFAGAPGTQEDITVRVNELRQDNSIVFFNTLRATITANSIANALTSGTAIFIGGGNNTVLVSRNDINGAGLNSSGVSVNPTAGPNQNVDVLGNSIRNARDGINVSDPNPGVAEIRNNSARENRRDGIRMALMTSLNIVANNFMRANVEHDCHDDSVNPANPPAFVANFWQGNDGITENRPGLCQDDDDEEECPDDDEDNDGLTNEREVLLLTLVSTADSDFDGIRDGNDDSNGNGEDDEDEDDDDDECPNDSDDDGEDDEDEDDDDEDDD